MTGQLILFPELCDDIVKLLLLARLALLQSRKLVGRVFALGGLVTLELSKRYGAFLQLQLLVVQPLDVLSGMSLFFGESVDLGVEGGDFIF